MKKSYTTVRVKEYLSSDTLSKIARKTRFFRMLTSVTVCKFFIADRYFYIDETIEKRRIIC